MFWVKLLIRSDKQDSDIEQGKAVSFMNMGEGEGGKSCTPFAKQDASSSEFSEWRGMHNTDFFWSRHLSPQNIVSFMKYSTRVITNVL